MGYRRRAIDGIDAHPGAGPRGCRTRPRTSRGTAQSCTSSTDFLSRFGASAPAESRIG